MTDRSIACTLAAALLLSAGAAFAQIPGGAKAVPPPGAEPELPASDLLVRYESPALTFRWSLAPEAALEPALVRALRAEALASREKTIGEANADKAAQDDRKYQQVWAQRWQFEAETDQLLAFSTKHITYTGGAHSNLVFQGVIWDRGAERRISFAELFQDSKGAMAVLKPAFCQALAEEQASRRQGEKNAMFSDCPDPSAYPILPIGEGQINAFRVLVPPYEAGPWSEGVYEILLDASSLSKFVAPRYVAAFAKP